MDAAEFNLAYSGILDLIDCLNRGARISVTDKNGKTMCFADYLGEACNYIINNNLYEEARVLSKYEMLFYNLHMYCSTNEASEEDKLMSKELEFDACMSIIGNLKFWLNRVGEEKVQGQSPEALIPDKSPRKGRPAKTLKDMMLNDGNGNRLQRIHELMTGKQGKSAALIILACIKKGWMEKPTFTQVTKEFGDIGARQGFTKYLSEGMFTQNEIDGATKNLGE